MGEQEINMEQEAINVTQGGGAVNSVNGKTGDVVLTTSDLENTSDYQTGSEVESAISTAIGDLPTVNDATLTIQKNGTTAGTFTANDADDTTINITVPTTAADVSALPTSTKYGASISVSINSSTYVMTTQLKDQNGNNLGSAQTVDLPLESVVVNGSYDSVNKKIVLTLQNGNTIDIPVADLVSGLQTEITTTNKLSADLVDDTSTTNKFVTASEKSTWNSKQDALTAGTNITIEEDSGTGDLVISASGGSGEGFDILTEDDVNWHDQKTGDGYVALWLLPTGHYTTDENSPNVVASAYEDIDGDYVAGDPVAVDMSPLIIINNNDPGNTYPDIMIIFPDSMINYIIDGSTGLVDATLEYGVPFMGTDGNADGVMGLVPAPATTDAGKFLKADGTWDTAGGGGGDTVYSDKTTSNVANGGAVYIGNLDTTQTEQADPTSTDNHYKYFWALPYSNTTIPGDNSINILGKAFSSRANNIILGSEAQAEASSVAIGLQSLAGSDSVSIGRMVNSAEGASFNNYSNYVSIGAGSRARNFGVSLGNSAKAMEDSTIAIGASTEAWQKGSVALGRGAYPSRVGEVNIGADSAAYGFNSTNYRVIGGVHDGQSAHDVATVGQVNSVIDSINAALSTNIPHIGA